MNWLEKYRPVTFDDLWQSDSPSVQLIRNCVAACQVPSVLLIVAPYGVGKTSLARTLGRRFVCEHGHDHRDNPCGQCFPCRDIRPFEGATFSRDGYFEMDVTQFTNTAAIPDHIREHARFNKLGAQSPHSEWVVCLDEIARVKNKIQEGLLKVVENIPDTVFVLCFSDPATIIEPIRERGVMIRLPVPSTAVAVTRLKSIAAAEGKSLDDTVARYIADSVKNIPRRCIKALQLAAASSPDKAITFEATKLAVEAVPM